MLPHTPLFSLKLIAAALCLLISLPLASAQVKYGSTLTLTGSAALFGQNAREGMELAREEINGAGGGRGKPLEILYEDIGETDLKKAAAAAQKFISIDRVNALFPMITEDAEVIWPIALRSKTVTMAMYAGGKELTQNRALMFQVSSSDEIFGKTLTDYAVSKGIRNGCMLVEESAYSVSIGHATQQYWRSKTGSEAVSLQYAPDTDDFRSYLLKMRAQNCEALFLLTSPNREGTVLSQLHAMHWNPLKLGLDISEDPSIASVAGAGINGLVYVKYLLATPQFKEKFEARYKHEVGAPAALAYDAVHIMSDVINRVGVSANDISKALLAIKEYSGASGVLWFDSDGTRHERVPELWIIKEGKPQKL